MFFFLKKLFCPHPYEFSIKLCQKLIAIENKEKNTYILKDKTGRGSELFG